MRIASGAAHAMRTTAAEREGAVEAALHVQQQVEEAVGLQRGDTEGLEAGGVGILGLNR